MNLLARQEELTRQEELILREHIRYLLHEAKILDRFKNWLKAAPKEANKILVKLKQTINQYPQLYPLFKKAASGNKLTKEEKKQVGDAIADALRLSVFTATFIPFVGPIVNVIATLMMEAGSETGICWRPSAFGDCELPPGAGKEIEENITESTLMITQRQLRQIVRDSLNEIKTVPSRWWEYEPDEVMADIYHQRRQIPPTDPKEREIQWQSIKKQLEKRYPRK